MCFEGFDACSTYIPNLCIAVEQAVKISAQEIVDNLHFPNGTAMIPAGAMVYISTDDPNGLCKDCLVKRKPCESYPSPKPPGCPEDVRTFRVLYFHFPPVFMTVSVLSQTSWKAFIKAGWKIRFMRDFARKGVLDGVNPNTHGMVESIVCSRATLFAGTRLSTFTGYIHRLRGYHGLGETSFYQTKKDVFTLQNKHSPGFGFGREWRAGWTDDAGELI